MTVFGTITDKMHYVGICNFIIKTLKFRHDSINKESSSGTKINQMRIKYELQNNNNNNFKVINVVCTFD
jgi:hypothetical protein